MKRNNQMKYRPLGKTGLQVSALAMGCMRLPENDPDMSAQIVDEAIASGINYFETTRGYINGKCQHLTAGGLKGRSRGLIVSGKTGVDENTTAKSYRKEMDLQMEILGVDYLEFYQVGWFSLDKLELLTKKGGALGVLHQAQAEGIIGHIGFTGHDKPENFTKLIETGIFDSLTVPYSMVHRQYEPTIKRAGELNVGVIAMCPVAGGMLAEPSETIQKLIPGGASTNAAAALKFVLSNPAVSCACSGMSTLEQLRENVITTNNFKAMSKEEWSQVQVILNEFQNLQDQFCTSCGYCMPCPNGLDIPANFRLYNYDQIYKLRTWAEDQYLKMDSGKRADQCNECGECEPKCPNEIPIIKQLKMVQQNFQRKLHKSA